MTQAEFDAALPYTWIPVPDDYQGQPGDIDPERLAGLSWEDLNRLARQIVKAFGNRPPQTPAEAWLVRLVRRAARREVRRLLARELPSAVARLLEEVRRV
jgi:hypothetical protein